MTQIAAKLVVLPEQQRELWPELASVPPSFVMYGGTALALCLGHRQSVDFDFFTTEAFTLRQLMQHMAFLANGQILESTLDTRPLSLSGRLLPEDAPSLTRPVDVGDDANDVGHRYREGLSPGGAFPPEARIIGTFREIAKHEKLVRSKCRGSVGGGPADAT